MQRSLELPSLSKCPKVFDWFFSAKWDLNDSIHINDQTHLAVKLYRRLMNQAMHIGDGIGSQGCLIDLIETLGKNETLLCPSQLTSKSDAMNFDIADKVASERIVNLLTEPEQSATKFYLQLILYVKHAYIDTTQEVLQRLYYSWYVVFATRIWRSHIVSQTTKKKSKTERSAITLQEDFITRNAYVCIEINGHSLLLFVCQSREMGKPELFLPYQTSSQDCENFFRSLRSMASTFFTVINLKVHEVLHKIRRLMKLEEIKNSMDPDLFQFHKKNTKSLYIPSSLPSDEEINEKIQLAYHDGKLACENIGIKCEQPPEIILNIHFDEKQEEKNCEMEPELKIIDFRHAFVESSDSTNINEGCLNIVSGSKVMSLKKSTILWSMFETQEKISQDRRHRFRTNIPMNRRNEEEINIGDYIKLKIENQEKIGQIVEFKNLVGKQIAINKTSISIKNKEILMSLNFFIMDSNKKLVFEKASEAAISTKQIITKIPPEELLKMLI